MRDSFTLGGLNLNLNSAPASVNHTSRGKWQPGEDHPNAKLTTEQVITARSRAASGERTIDLAAAYGISPSHMSAVLSGRRWNKLKHKVKALGGETEANP